MAKRGLVTKRGFNMFDMSPLLQKSIRRCKPKEAAFAARELYDTYCKRVWKRLLVIGAEDCYGIMTKEILALKASGGLVNEGKKPGRRDTICSASLLDYRQGQHQRLLVPGCALAIAEAMRARTGAIAMRGSKKRNKVTKSTPMIPAQAAAIPSTNAAAAAAFPPLA